MLIAPPAAAPDSATLSGPGRFLRGRRQARTEAVELGKLKETVTLSKRLLPPPANLKQEPAQVSVTVQVALVATRTLANVPITPLVDAGQRDVAVFPPVVNLVVSGPEDGIRDLVLTDIAVTVPLTGLSRGRHRLRGQVILPEGFSLVSLEPEEFTIIIGQDGDRPQERR
jgi:hypothetical protein